DLTYGSVVGRWDPSTFREDRAAGPDGVKREGLTFLFPDTEPALNAGARVQLSSQGATMHVVLVPIARQYSSEPIGPAIPLADGGFLPRAGHYLLQVRAVKAGDVEVWRGPVSIIPPGTFQLLWFNDGTGSHGEPVISMAVNGVQTKAGMLDATGIGKNGGEPTPYPLPDRIPTVGQALTVASGTPIVMLDRSTRLGSSGTGNVQLSFGSPVPPYGRLGTIPLVGPKRVIPARPGDYLFRVHVDTAYGANQHAFVGFLVCRIHVIAAPGT
ncbi:MAG: hypothetical protein QOI60_311, partial [Actinomycetota bacterium]|nr:hypothetical protein [Actinomycetota bacterium]